MGVREVVLLWLLLLQVAQAMCEMPDPRLLPADGTVDVPTDVQPVWITTSSAIDEHPVQVWFGDDLAGFSVDWEDSAGDLVYGHLGLDEPPLPGTVVTVSDGVGSASFTVGDGPEDAAPAVPEPVLFSSGASRDHMIDCDSYASSPLAPAALVKVITPTWLADGGYLQGRVLGPDGSELLILGYPEQIFVEAGGCPGTNAEAILDWDAFDLQLRGVTWAGALTAWSEPLAVTLPWPLEPDCTGCSTVAPVQAWPALLALLLGLPRRRRRS